MTRRLQDLPAGLPAENGAGAAGSTAAAITPPRADAGAPGPSAAVSGRPGPQLVVISAKIEIGLGTLTGGVVTRPQTLPCDIPLIDEAGEEADLFETMVAAAKQITERLAQLRRGEP